MFLVRKERNLPCLMTMLLLASYFYKESIRSLVATFRWNLNISAAVSGRAAP